MSLKSWRFMAALSLFSAGELAGVLSWNGKPLFGFGILVAVGLAYAALTPALYYWDGRHLKPPAQDDRESLKRRIEELEAELKTLADEAAEIEDESEEARFSRAIHTLRAAEEESTADRIVKALEPQLTGRGEVARAAVLAELRSAWK